MSGRPPARSKAIGIIAILLVVVIVVGVTSIAFPDGWRKLLGRKELSATSPDDATDTGTGGSSKVGPRHPSLKETASLNSALKELSEAKNQKARKALLEKMVVNFGRQFPEQMLELIRKYEPVSETPGPLLDLVIMNAGVKPKFTEIGLREFPSGKDHSSILSAAIRGTNLEDLPAFLNSLHNPELPEDDRDMAKVIWQQHLLGGPEFSEDDLNHLMTSVNSKEVAQAISREFGSRLRHNYPNGLEDVPPADELVKNVAEPFRQDALVRFYEDDLQSIVSLSPVQLAEKGVPESLLSDYVQMLGRVRNSQDGPLNAIQTTADIPENLREDYLVAVSDRWIRTNPEEAGSEVLKMPSGADRDVLISQLVDQYLESGDTASAKQWTGRMADSSRRLEAGKKITAPR